MGAQHYVIIHMTHSQPRNEFLRLDDAPKLIASLMTTPRRVVWALSGFPGAPGGGRKPRQSGGPGGGRIILPGQQPERNTPRLFVPGQTAPSQAEVQPTRRNFRPPPGFMDKVQEGDKEQGSPRGVDDMVKKLKSQSEVWHVLATFLAPLAAEGLDAAVLEEVTGLTKVEQNVLAVAANVRRSLAQGVQPNVLAFYDAQGTQALLYQLRFLTGKPRLTVAEYVAENNLGTEAAWDLARAVKEHVRRNGKMDGFSDDPEDCLAYECYRNAIETREKDVKLDYIEKGLDIALTPSAVSALEKLRQEILDTSSENKHLNVLPYAKLTKDDMGSRPVAVAGFFSEVTEDMITNCPTANRSGQFGCFQMDASNTHSWMVLPGWEILMSAHDPIALEFPDCHASMPTAACSALGATLEKRKKLKGGAMALVDRKYGSVSNEAFYIVKLEDGRFDIVQGHEGIDAYGEVILLLRPPDQELAYSSLSGLEI